MELTEVSECHKDIRLRQYNNMGKIIIIFNAFWGQV